VAGALFAGIKGVMDLGEAIRLRRTEPGMSQAALAKAAGVDTRQIRRYEAASSTPCSPRPWPSPQPFAFR
jgi:transcriptional regulator with XRE-family HTH domain